MYPFRLVIAFWFLKDKGCAIRSCFVDYRMDAFSVFDDPLTRHKKTPNFKKNTQFQTVPCCVSTWYSQGTKKVRLTWSYPSRDRCLRWDLAFHWYICKPPAGTACKAPPGAGNTGAAEESLPPGSYWRCSPKRTCWHGNRHDFVEFAVRNGNQIDHLPSNKLGNKVEVASHRCDEHGSFITDANYKVNLRFWKIELL